MLYKKFMSCVVFLVAKLEGELTDIEALKDLKLELTSQKEVSCVPRQGVE